MQAIRALFFINVGTCEGSQLRLQITAVSLLVALLGSLFQNNPATAAGLQENPETTPLVYDGVALFQKYVQAVGLVPSGDTAGLQLLRDEAEYANIPPELRTTAANFLLSCVNIGALVPELQSELEEAKTLQAQYRIADALPVLESVKDKLKRAYAGLLVMDNAAADTGRWWNVDSLRAEDPLNAAYRDVREQLRNVRNLLDLLYNMESSMVQIKPGASLRASSLSIAIDPDTAWVGDTIVLRGTLSSEGIPLEGRIITVLMDNIPVGSALTGSAGVYEASVTVPFKYVPVVNLKAVFFPADNDVGQYLGTSSRLAELNVLFYRTTLRVSQGTPANPGRDFLVTAVFSYNDSPAPDGRYFSIYLDRNLVFKGTVGQNTFLRLPVASGTTPGTHSLSCYATPSGRYAPAGYEMPVEVNLVAPVIEVDAPRLFFLPFSREIEGKVFSSFGPLINTAVEISVGGWRASEVTREDGIFSARLDTGLSPSTWLRTSLTLLGRQQLRVTAIPEEPWYKTVSVETPVTVINPVSMTGILLVLAIPFWFFVRERRRVRLLTPRFLPVPAPPAPFPDNISTPANAGSILVTLYKGVLTLVQAAAGLVLQPCQTLGEFALEAGSKLGNLAVFFHEFTRIVERHLYSKHSTAGTDTIRAKELGRTIMTGIKHENP